VVLFFALVAMIPGVAHALELPGKLRLSRDAYFAVQPIYYPGFTIAGLAEPIAVVAGLVCLVVTPAGTTDFWLTLIAVLALAGMHAVYWLVTHRVNGFWLEGRRLGRAGARFFGVGAEPRPADAPRWTELRDRWEYSHVVRAALSVVGVVVMIAALRAA